MDRRQLFGGTHGFDLGGDGWLVLAAGCAAVLPLVLPLPASSLKGFWVLALAAGAGYVCFVHFGQASVDGFDVDWGLQVAAVGSALLGLSGLRLLLARV